MPRVITRYGLRKHLEDRVFVGKNEELIVHFISEGDGPVKYGFLCKDDLGFYLIILKRQSILSIGRRFARPNGEVYRIENGDIIRIYEKGDPRNYKVDLS